MKFLNFTHAAASGSALRLGAMLDTQAVLDLTSSWPEGDAPDSVDALIAGGEAALALVAEQIGLARRQPLKAPVLNFAELDILPPVALQGRNIFNVGRNYREHIIEGNIANGRPANAFPQAIEFFTKPRTALVGHRAAIPRHAKLTQALDYEAELAIVIGKRGVDIPPEQAMQYVFGYTILNDVTARDLQRLHGQWFKGKSLDGSCPLGPCVVHASAIANPNRLQIELDVDGELRQSDNTASMLFDIATIVAELSKGMTLLPGDVIATGTPKGVGFAQLPPRCLEVGQTVRVRIEGIGELVNTVTH
ncbi:fumarylacetoacetate hydrolase family protein [Vandammella animalimorsus]|uniref:fumarylacetoacetate hydrolase family protein n=1 Tax=Vandammella animalimorsus TaxID=2029117 RepID=UPI0031B9B57C